jgi:hypothetical protein
VSGGNSGGSNPVIATGSPEVDRGIVSLLVAGALAWLQRLLQAKVKLRWSIPHQWYFAIPTGTAPPVASAPGSAPSNLVKTQTLLIGNFGRAAATNVEVFLAFRPQHFDVWPLRSFEEVARPNLQFALRFGTLAPKEVFQIEMITAGELPVLGGVRSDAGEGKSANFRIQPVAPRWITVLLLLLVAIGMASVIYVALLVLERLIWL